jgi:hypothetical protein
MANLFVDVFTAFRKMGPGKGNTINVLRNQPVSRQMVLILNSGRGYGGPDSSIADENLS